MLQYIISGEKPTTLDLDIEEIDEIVTKVKANAEVTKEYMKQWDREATLQREAAEEATNKTRRKDALDMIRFDLEENIPTEATRKRILTMGFSESELDTLFEQVNSEYISNS